MGLRFNKRVKICKGVNVNLGKKGASISIGTKGARATFGKDGVRTTVGIPGTGISYTDYKKYNNDNKIKNANKEEDLNSIYMPKLNKISKQLYTSEILLILLGIANPLLLIVSVIGIYFIYKRGFSRDDYKENKYSRKAIKKLKSKEYNESYEYCLKALEINKNNLNMQNLLKIFQENSSNN